MADILADIDTKGGFAITSTRFHSQLGVLFLLYCASHLIVLSRKWYQESKVRCSLPGIVVKGNWAYKVLGK